jgi:hypothetical protein
VIHRRYSAGVHKSAACGRKDGQADLPLAATVRSRVIPTGSTQPRCHFEPADKLAESRAFRTIAHFAEMVRFAHHDTFYTSKQLRMNLQGLVGKPTGILGYQELSPALRMSRRWHDALGTNARVPASQDDPNRTDPNGDRLRLAPDPGRGSFQQMNRWPGRSQHR